MKDDKHYIGRKKLMINKKEFKELLAKDVENVDKAYSMYKNLSKKSSLDDIKKILALDNERLSRLRNSVCEKYLVEISPSELKDLIKILELIYETNEEEGPSYEPK